MVRFIDRAIVDPRIEKYMVRIPAARPPAGRFGDGHATQLVRYTEATFTPIAASNGR